MTDCNNCPYTDEYCASGDCERNADVSKTLTEQWKKGELPVGEYYLLYTDGTTDREYYDWANFYEQVAEKGFSTDPNDIKEVLAPVPSYDEWKELIESEEKSHLQADSYYNKILELTDLLEKAEKVLFEVMDCREDREFYKDLADKYYEYKYGKYLNGEQNG